MASMHIASTPSALSSFDFLCRDEYSTNGTVVLPGESLGRLTDTATGAVEWCPECALRHAARGGRVKVRNLVAQVRAEVAGTTQAADTLERYESAAASLRVAA